MPFTLGFRDRVDLIEHFDRHAMDFGATTEEEYELLADYFLGAPRTAGMYECFRRNGAMVRYDILTDEFGVLAADNYIQSYYHPQGHNCASNLDYFRKQCK